MPMPHVNDAWAQGGAGLPTVSTSFSPSPSQETPPVRTGLPTVSTSFSPSPSQFVETPPVRADSPGLDLACRVCLSAEEHESNPLICPCACRGTQRMLHRDCLVALVAARGECQDAHPCCELCRQPYFGVGALALAQDAMQRAESISDDSARKARMPMAMLQSAEALVDAGRDAEAEVLLRNAIVGFEESYGVQHPYALASVGALAVLLDRLGSPDQAEPLHRRALTGSELVLGSDHPETLTVMQNLALHLKSRKEFEEAESLMRRSLAGMERALGEHDPSTLVARSNLAIVLEGRGQYTAAEPLLRSVLRERQRVLGHSHPETLVAINNLAFTLTRLGQDEEALALHRQAVKGKERTLGLGHPSTVTSLHHLAGMLKRAEKDKEAEEVYRRVLISCGHRSDSLDTLLAAANIVLLLTKRGADEEAEPLCRRALDGFYRKLGKDHDITVSCAKRLADIQLRRAGKDTSTACKAA